VKRKLDDLNKKFEGLLKRMKDALKLLESKKSNKQKSCTSVNSETSSFNNYSNG
jgi:hypothetical protein